MPFLYVLVPPSTAYGFTGGRRLFFFLKNDAPFFKKVCFCQKTDNILQYRQYYLIFVNILYILAPPQGRAPPRPLGGRPQAPQRAAPGPHGAGDPRPSRCGRPQALTVRAAPGPHGAGGPRPSRCGRPQAPRRACDKLGWGHMKIRDKSSNIFNRAPTISY